MKEQDAGCNSNYPSASSTRDQQSAGCRHYTFYLWRRVMMASSALPYALVPVYIYAAWSIHESLSKRQSQVWIAGLAAATFVTLVPAALLELRFMPRLARALSVIYMSCSCCMFRSCCHGHSCKLQHTSESRCMTRQNSLALPLPPPFSPPPPPPSQLFSTGAGS